MLGPLTNLAKAIISFPKISSIIDEVIVMGGAFFTEGNATKYAEFNIYADAESASIVFNSKLNIRVVGLDVCNDLIIDKIKFYNNDLPSLKSFVLFLEDEKVISANPTKYLKFPKLARKIPKTLNQDIVDIMLNNSKYLLGIIVLLLSLAT